MSYHSGNRLTIGAAMSMMDRIRRRLGRGDWSPDPYHTAHGVEDLQRLGLVSLAEIAEGTQPFVERRREQKVGPQEGHVVMRRRAGDWTRTTDVTTGDQQQE